MKLLAATGNNHKLIEFERILSPLGIEILSSGDTGINPDVKEDGATFAENAILKATAMHKLSGLPVVADDSGLCVDALNGRPGVHSSRYLGNAPQSEKNTALLKELENAADRTARFVCSICCVINDYTIITAEGSCEGEIAISPRGDGGFGYDPIFMVNERSFAELSDMEKDALSHRGRALRSLAEKLRQYLKDEGGKP